MSAALSVLFPVGAPIVENRDVCRDCGAIVESLPKHHLQTHRQIQGLILCAWQRDQGSCMFGLPRCAMERILQHLRLKGCCADCVTHPAPDPKHTCALI